MLAAMLFVACAHNGKKAEPAKAEPAKEPAKSEPAKAEPAAVPAGAAVKVEFASASATKAGAPLEDTKYSEQANDASIDKKEFADGVVTFSGQVGLGKGSQWAGIGFWAPVFKDLKTMDATKYKSVTFKLASTAGTLRLRIAGGDQAARSGGCYPVVMQEVTPTLAEYTIPLEKFKAESWCGPKAIAVPDTMKSFYGYEIADISVAKKPVTISVQSITLNP
jgi:hypothetical protein